MKAEALLPLIERGDRKNKAHRVYFHQDSTSCTREDLQSVHGMAKVMKLAVENKRDLAVNLIRLIKLDTD